LQQKKIQELKLKNYEFTETKMMFKSIYNVVSCFS
jgi:hypothetical protein